MGKIKIQRGWYEQSAQPKTSSVLLRGHTEDVPLELFGSPFHLHTESHKVYVFFNADRVLYVGKTSAFDRRIYDHQDRYGTASLIYFEVESSRESEMLETALIHLLSPSNNRSKLGDLCEIDVATLLSNGIVNFEHKLKDQVLRESIRILRLGMGYVGG